MKLADIAAHLVAGGIDTRIVGDAGVEISALATIQDTVPGTLAFVAQAKYQSFLADSKAAAVIVNESLVDKCPGNALVVANPYLAFARVSHLFDKTPKTEPGIHPTAVVAADAHIAADACIGPYAVIESGAQIDAKVVVGAHCFIGANTRIGAASRLWSNVTIYHHVTIGQRTIIHAGAVLGADGFGFAPDSGRWQKIAQVGSVTVGDDVEIGPLTTIDRGAIDDTVIGNGVIIDDQVHIAHNVRIGDYSAIAGKVGFAGSVTVGKHCMVAGMAGFNGHIEICDNVTISGMTAVTRSITEPGVYTSGTGMEPHASWAKNAARFRQLDAMARRLSELEKRLRELDGKG